MKTVTKVALISAGILVLSGTAITAVALANVNFDFTKLNSSVYEKMDYETAEGYKNIFIENVSDDVSFRVAESNQTYVEYWDSENIKYEITVSKDEENELRIIQKDQRQWYERLFSFDFGQNHSLTVYLPKKDYERLHINSVSGDIDLSGGYSFKDSASIVTVSGNVLLSGTEGFGSLYTESVSGDVRAEKTGSVKNAQFKSVSGDVRLISFKTDSGLFVNTVSGDAEFDDLTVKGNISIETVSGDVEGTISSGKSGRSYDTDTVSGDVDVPRSSKGGADTKINTVSGDIKIKET